MGGAVENMALAATALGLSSCWMVAPVLACDEIKNILKLSDNEKITTLLAVGKPYTDNPNKPPKKELDEVMEIIR